MLGKFVCLLLLPLSLVAVDYSPWTERDLELLPRLTATYQQFRSVETSKGPSWYRSNDFLMQLAVSGSYERFSAQIDLDFAKTRHIHTFAPTALGLSGCYTLLNDVIGDPVTLTVGLTLRPVFGQARRDPACFYHGHFEAELHAAVGKEWVCEQFWTQRGWGYLSLGFADMGSPWLLLGAQWEHNLWDIHRFGLGLDGSVGFGRGPLHLHHFLGYGPVRQAALDASLNYSRIFSYGITLTLSAAHRFYAQNCPRNCNWVGVSLLYPIGL